MKIEKFKSFNSAIFLKDYGQKYPISNLKKGDKVLYRGTNCTVVEPNDYAVKIVSDSGENYLVNQSLFNQFSDFRQQTFHIYNKSMTFVKMPKNRKKSFQYEDLSYLPTDIAQSQIDGSTRQYSNYVIQERRFRKWIRVSSVIPIYGLFLCDKYQHRWYVMNKSFVYFASLSSFFTSLFFIIYLIIFVL